MGGVGSGRRGHRTPRAVLPRIVPADESPEAWRQVAIHWGQDPSSREILTHCPRCAPGWNKGGSFAVQTAPGLVCSRCAATPASVAAALVPPPPFVWPGSKAALVVFKDAP